MQIWYNILMVIIMNLNFSNERYKTIAFNSSTEKESVYAPEDAFFLLINGLELKELENLCYMIQIHYKNSKPSIDLTLDRCYELTQNLYTDSKLKKFIYMLAQILANNKLPLGTKKEGQYNTSEWINHAILSSKICTILAKELNLNENHAANLGLLHDYGRKINHSFEHTIKGYEALIDKGWYNEAIGCLTHSFLKGERCANNEPAVEGFFIDELGNTSWKPNTKKDDITTFLENYNFTEYDILLNIADLMATSKDIVAPHERLKDIASRRKIDPINRLYFLKKLINLLIETLHKLGYKDINSIKQLNTIEEAEKELKYVSEYFFNVFNQLNNNKEQRKNLA